MVFPAGTIADPGELHAQLRSRSCASAVRHVVRDGKAKRRAPHRLPRAAGALCRQDPGVRGQAPRKRHLREHWRGFGIDDGHEPVDVHGDPGHVVEQRGGAGAELCECSLGATDPSVSSGCRGCLDGWRRPAQVVCAITASFGRGRERHMAVAAGVTIDARVAPFKDLGVVMARSNAEATMFGDAWRAA